jgi:predicted nucleic acid-binding Zn ribbon protein
MRRLADALPTTIRALGIARRTREAQAMWLWPEVVGAELAAETRALKLSGGTLWVSASSAPLAHQLHLERRRLLDRLNARIGAPVVRDIRFRQAVTAQQSRRWR